MNALLYAANTQPQSLTSGQAINFGIPVRRYGQNIGLSGGNVVTNGKGYYVVHAGVTFVPLGGGVATLQLFEDGIPIPGANVSIQVAANTTYNLVCVPPAVRIKCCEEKVITAAIFNVSANVSNASVLVEKA